MNNFGWMKKGSFAALGVVILFMPACATETWSTSTRNTRTMTTAPTVLIDYFDKRSERKKGVLPESEWNRLGLWRQVADDPPTYIPDGYSDESPRTEQDGTWYIDKRDGKRVFVPDMKVGDYGPSVLQAEATKVTSWAH